MGNTKYSVLIVDDQDNWRELLAEVLEKNFDVVSVRSQIEAMDAISNKIAPFHVVVTDMRLKDDEIGNEDGLVLLKYLQTRGNETQSIVVTGYPTIETTKKTLNKLDAFDYLEKHPSSGSKFDPEEFQKIVQTAAEEAEKSRNHLVFVLMPFAKKYEDFYKKAIKNVITKMKFECKRVDDFYGSRSIMGDILKHIEKALFILADLSGRNPNVFFEVGISHAIGKCVLLLTQNLKDVPPTLQVIRCHQYQSSLAGAEEVNDTLRNAVQEMQLGNFPPFFPKKDFIVLPKTCIVLMPSNKTSDRAYKDLIRPALKEAHCEVEKADEIFNSNSILDETWARINSSEVIIADLSGRDADVFYLAGLAYGLKKKMIYLARNGTDIPFDLKAGSHLVYALDPFASGFKAQQKLTQLVKGTLS